MFRSSARVLDMNSVQITGRPAGPAPTPVPAAELRGPFAALGRFVVRRRRLTLAGFLVGLVVATVLGSQMFTALQSAGYDDPGSESAKALTATQQTFGVQDPVVVLAVESPAGIDDPAGTAAATALVGRLAEVKGVTATLSYWTSGKPDGLRGKDGRTGQVLVYAKDADDAAQMDLASTVVDRFGGRHDGLDVQVGGFATVSDSITRNVKADLARAESIAVPLTMVLLLVVFGGVVAAGLPFTVAVGSILGSFAVVWVVTTATDVSVFALNLITGLGLGLGIDYALLVVNRFREELKAGHSPDDAVVRTVATAGRTVAVSGVTVAVVLAALLFFPQYFLKSFGYAGIAATLLAVVSAVTALPALLAVLGTRVDRWKVRRGDLAPKDQGAWSTIARFVMHRPWPVLVAAVAVLAALAAPALGVAFSQADSRVLPATDPAAAASELLATRFPGQEGTPIDVVLPGAAGGTAAAVRDYAIAVSKVDGVVRVTTPADVVASGAVLAPNPQPAGFTAGSDVRLLVISGIAPRTLDGQDQIRAIRAVPAPGPERLVGGAAAQYTDSQAAIGSRGRWALLWVALATLVVLFLYTGSVLLPLKAVALNVLSLSATLGVLVWVFQEGRMRWLVGDFTVTHSIDTSMAVLIAVTAFALSMDYEVFLLSRIKEEHDAGKPTVEAVAFGLQRSGRIITAAAVLLAVVFATFVSSGVTSIKELGFGVAFAILLDATVVRGLLVPAFMRVAGRWNWWAPRPLAAVHRRFGLSEG
jgi:putative drug exporter of the RND superfamily